MTTLRQLCAATMLSLTLTISAFAGHIDCPGVVAPPPGTTTTTSAITTTVIQTIVRLTY